MRHKKYIVEMSMKMRKLWGTLSSVALLGILLVSLPTLADTNITGTVHLRGGRTIKATNIDCYGLGNNKSQTVAVRIGGIKRDISVASIRRLSFVRIRWDGTGELIKPGSVINIGLKNGHSADASRVWIRPDCDVTWIDPIVAIPMRLV